jgi:hypothetical protein
MAELATRQHGVVARRQLLAAGLSPSQVERRVRAGRLHVVHRGAYAVGHPVLSRRGRELAAVLASGAGAVLRARSAASLLELVPWSGRIQVATPHARRGIEGADVRRTRRMDPADVTTRHGVPCTSWARTLVDLGDAFATQRLARILENAVHSGIYDHRVLMATLERSRGVSGAARVRNAIALGHHLSPQTTRSALEDAFLDLVRGASPALPQPRLNAWLVLSGDVVAEVDALWERERVVIELDSRYHDLVGGRLRDAERDAALRRDGYRARRLRWADVVGDPGGTLRWIRDALAGR